MSWHDPGETPQARGTPMLTPNPDSVPTYLTNLPRWVLWRIEQRVNRQTGETEQTKPPISYRTGKYCDVTDAANWTDFGNVTAALEKSRAWDGIGFVLGDTGQGEWIIGADFDECLDDDEAIAPWAMDPLVILHTYTDKSPGGHGLKPVARIRATDVPEARRLLHLAENEYARTKIFGEKTNGHHAPGVVLYLGRRFFTVTGRAWHATPEDVALLDLRQIALLAYWFGPKQTTAPSEPAHRDDDGTEPEKEALRDRLGAEFLRNPRLRERWEGGTQGLNDASRSGRDMSIVALLVTAGFTKGETRAALRLFEHGKLAEEQQDPKRGTYYFEQMWSRTNATPHAGPEPPPGWEEDHPPVDCDSLEADEPAAPSGRITLKIIKGEYVQTAEQIESIATTATLPIYSHSEALCRPVTEQRKRHDGQLVTVAVLRNYNSASLRRALDPAIRFSKFDGRRKASVACEPPVDIINMVLAGEQKQIFPPIRGIIGTPVLRPNRTIITTPGYDAETGYYLVDPPEMPPIPAAPTRDDALKALAVLDDLLSEFPFVDDVSKSVVYSGLITPLVRAACDVVPGHLFTAPKQGSGKSLLVDVAAAIATGERAYAILAHKQPEEQDKQLTGALLEARQIIALDNLTGEIESAVLAQVTEREHISVRPLGTSKTVSVMNGFNTYLTGNNVSVAGDNTRRLLVGRVDPKIENPLDLTFQKQNPVTRVFNTRGEFIAACLTIVLAHIAQGRPCRLTPTPSYEAWSELVREPLVWLGLPDPTDSMRAAFDDDPNNATLDALMAAWPSGQTDWTCAELIDAAQEMDPANPGPLYPGLADALKPIARDRRGFLDPGVLGNYLRQNRDKIVGGRKITRRSGSAHGGASRWFLTKA
jgi:hypothetical protein